jgi:hypothetical protein
MTAQAITALVFGLFGRSWALGLRRRAEEDYLTTTSHGAVARLAVSVVAEAVAAFCILAGVLGVLGGLAEAYMIGVGT